MGGIPVLLDLQGEHCPRGRRAHCGKFEVAALGIQADITDKETLLLSLC